MPVYIVGVSYRSAVLRLYVFVITRVRLVTPAIQGHSDIKCEKLILKKWVGGNTDFQNSVIGIGNNSAKRLV